MGVCSTESSSSTAGRDGGHLCGPAALIRETIKHETEPVVPGAPGQEGEGSQEENGDGKHLYMQEGKGNETQRLASRRCKFLAFAEGTRV